MKSPLAEQRIDRVRLAHVLASLGRSHTQIAEALDLTPATVWYYLRGSAPIHGPAAVFLAMPRPTSEPLEDPLAASVGTVATALPEPLAAREAPQRRLPGLPAMPGFVPALVLALAVLAPQAHAQGLAGAATGRVVDSGRAPLSGARVAFEHLVSGHAPERMTNARGRYTQRGLRIDGPYRVWTYAPGFRWETTLIQPVLLQTTRLDVRLRREGECDEPTTTKRSDAWRYERGRERAPCNTLDVLPPREIEAALTAPPTPQPQQRSARLIEFCDRGFCRFLSPGESP